MVILTKIHKTEGKCLGNKVGQLHLQMTAIGNNDNFEIDGKSKMCK